MSNKIGSKQKEFAKFLIEENEDPNSPLFGIFTNEHPTYDIQGLHSLSAGTSIGYHNTVRINKIIDKNKDTIKFLYSKS